MHLTYEQYHDFSAPLEGRVPGMYCDMLGLITCAVGNLIDTRGAGYPARLVEAINWTLADGSGATVAEVRADWHLLKSQAARFAKLHWKYALAATKCRLAEAEIDRIVKERLAINVAEMRKLFADWDAWPADAQLAILSMCWAVGTGWPTKFPRFFALVKAREWERAAAFDDPKNPKGNWPGKIREAGNPGIVPRNLKNRFCLLNAALVKEHGLPVDVLHWPNAAQLPTRTGGLTATGTGEALQAKQEAELQLAAWQALEVCPYQSPLGGRAMLDHEAQP